MEENIYTENQYFASANGFSGFKSYFETVFNSRDYDAVYILKGGPGTGKSTILKRLLKVFGNGDAHCEIFRCSSDPKSLDAIIIERKDIRVAVLDGTAPHMRDADIPGAVDSLINLADAWDDSTLRSLRKKIESINAEKSDFYRRAYDYLHHSSIFDTNIVAEISKSFDFARCSEVCEQLIQRFSLTEKGEQKIRLLSSFSKYGYKTIEGFENRCESNYYIGGKFGSERLFLKTFVKVIKDKQIKACLIPSPLDENSYEAVAFNDGSLMISAHGKGSFLYDSAELFKNCDLTQLEKNIHPLGEGKEYYLKLAAEELNKASDCHFMLEEIYTPCMNFGILDDIFEKLLKKIKNMLQSAV